MDDQMTSKAYETPRVVDYGDLQELTASCVGSSKGDSRVPGGMLGGEPVGPSTSVCTSKP